MTFCAVYKLICFFKAIYALVSNVINGCGVHQNRMSRKFQFNVLIIDVLIVNSPLIHCSFFYFHRCEVMRFFDLCRYSFTLTIVRSAFRRAHTHTLTQDWIYVHRFRVYPISLFYFDWQWLFAAHCSVLTYNRPLFLIIYECLVRARIYLLLFPWCLLHTIFYRIIEMTKIVYTHSVSLVMATNHKFWHGLCC